MAEGYSALRCLRVHRFLFRWLILVEVYKAMMCGFNGQQPGSKTAEVLSWNVRQMDNHSKKSEPFLSLRLSSGDESHIALALEDHERPSLKNLADLVLSVRNPEP